MSADKKECVTGLSADMSKAFDASHHAPPIQRLKAYRLNDISLKVLRFSFDSGRNRVKLQDAHSEWKEQPRRCQQGFRMISH